MPPLLTSGVRFMFAGGVMYAALLMRGGRERARLKPGELVGVVLVGAALVAGGNGLVMVAERDAPSGLAALIMASIPLWVIAMRRGAAEPIARATLAGTAVGFGGVALLVLPGGGESRGGAVALLTLVLAAFLWACGTFASRRVRLPADPVLSTAAQMLAGGLVALLAGLARGEAASTDLQSFSADSLLALAYLVVFGSLIAFTAYVWVLQHAPVSRVATYAYVNPVIAILLGWLFVDEAITATIVLGAVVILAAVAVVVREE